MHRVCTKNGFINKKTTWSHSLFFVICITLAAQSILSSGMLNRAIDTYRQHEKYLFYFQMLDTVNDFVFGFHLHSKDGFQ